MANRVPPPRDFQWARLLRTLSFWALLTVGVVALIQFTSGRRQDVGDVSYTRFAEELDRGNVATVEITERQQLRGQFKQSITLGRRKFDRFITLLPFETSDAWV